MPYVIIHSLNIISVYITPSFNHFQFSFSFQSCLVLGTICAHVLQKMQCSWVRLHIHSLQGVPTSMWDILPGDGGRHVHQTMVSDHMSTANNVTGQKKNFIELHRGTYQLVVEKIRQGTYDGEIISRRPSFIHSIKGTRVSSIVSKARVCNILQNQRRSYTKILEAFQFSKIFFFSLFFQLSQFNTWKLFLLNFVPHNYVTGALFKVRTGYANSKFF